ncbi:MAG: hypothetical protein U0230_09350 [Polyangiales bacterium]
MQRGSELLRGRRGAGEADARIPRRRVAALVLATTALFASSASIGAQEPGDPSARLTGTWSNHAGDGGRAAIERGVEAGIEDLFALGKPTARSRLLESNPPIPTLHIEVASGRVRVDLGHGRNTAAAPGAWQPARSAGGDAIRIRYTMTSDGVLILDSVSDGGSGRHTFRVSEDGNTLRHSVRVESSRLPDDIRYTLTYRRTP